MGILKYVLHFKKYTWCSLLPNICSCVFPVKKKKFFEMCSKTTGWMVRRCLSVTFNNAHVGYENFRRGLVLGMLTGESQATRQGRASESSGWNSMLVPEAIFSSCRVSPQQVHPARVGQAFTLRLSLHNLLLWSTLFQRRMLLEREDP